MRGSEELKVSAKHEKEKPTLTGSVPVLTPLPSPTPTPTTPEQVDSLLLKASLQQIEGNYEKALELFESAIQAFPQNPQGWIGKGKVLVLLGNLEASLFSFERALKLDPKNLFVTLDKVDALEQLGKDEEATKAIERAIIFRPTDGTLWCNKGVIHLKCGDYVNALESFENALKIDSYDVSAWYHKGVLLKLRGKRNEAGYCFEKVKDLDPKFTPSSRCISPSDFPSVLLGSTRKRDNSGGKNSKKGIIRSVFCKNVFHTGITPEQKGRRMHIEGNLFDALKCYEKALKIDPEDPDLWFNKACVLQSIGKIADAKKCFKAALKLNSNDVLSLYNIGCIVQSQGNYVKALAYYDRASRIDSDYALIVRKKSEVEEIICKYRESKVTSPSVPFKSPRRTSSLPTPNLSAKVSTGNPEISDRVRTRNEDLQLESESDHLIIDHTDPNNDSPHVLPHHHHTRSQSQTQPHPLPQLPSRSKPKSLPHLYLYPQLHQQSPLLQKYNTPPQDAPTNQTRSEYEGKSEANEQLEEAMESIQDLDLSNMKSFDKALRRRSMYTVLDELSFNMEAEDMDTIKEFHPNIEQDEENKSSYYSQFTGDLQLLVPFERMSPCLAPDGGYFYSCDFNINHPIVAQLANLLSTENSPFYIDRAEVVLNPSQQRLFFGCIEKSEIRSTHKVFKPDLTEESKIQDRLKILKEALSPDNPYILKHSRSVPIARLYHGTSSRTARNICATGFASLALIDLGWFGSGIYLSNDPIYCLEYVKSKKDPCLIITDALLFNSLPIISDDAPPHVPPNQFKFYGKPHYKNYATHIVPVVPWGPLDYRPPPSATPSKTTEFVIFNENHLLPRILVHLKKIGHSKHPSHPGTPPLPSTPTVPPLVLPSHSGKWTPHSLTPTLPHKSFTPSPKTNTHSPLLKQAHRTDTPARYNRTAPTTPSPNSRWEVQDVVSWLGQLRLSEDYSHLIHDNAIDGEVLLTMQNSEDWKDIGMKKFGDIRKCVSGLKENPK